MIHEAIRKILSDDSAVAAIVDGRIYVPPVIVSAEQPYIVFQISANPIVQSLSDYSGLDETVLRIDCNAEKLRDAKRLANAVFDAMRSIRDYTFLDHIIKGIEFGDRGRDLYEREARMYLVRLECTAWVQPAE